MSLPKKLKNFVLFNDGNAYLGEVPEVTLPKLVTKMEDYRAGLGPDRDHDDEDHHAGRQVTCPTLVLWATEDDLEALYGDVLAVWRPWAADLRGHPFRSSHHMAEEAPEELAAELLGFLSLVSPP